MIFRLSLVFSLQPDSYVNARTCEVEGEQRDKERKGTFIFQTILMLLTSLFSKILQYNPLQTIKIIRRRQHF